MEINKVLIQKAKRRIKRFIETGESQARVTKNKVHKNVFNYRVNGQNYIHLKVDKMRRCRLINMN